MEGAAEPGELSSAARARHRARGHEPARQGVRQGDLPLRRLRAAALLVGHQVRQTGGVAELLPAARQRDRHQHRPRLLHGAHRGALPALRRASRARVRRRAPAHGAPLLHERGLAQLPARVTARGAASARLTLVLGLGGGATTTAPPPDLPRGGGWLDQILLPWNERGAAVPKPPPPSPQQGENLARCRPGIRGPLTPAERAVTAAGWWLYPNSTRSLGDVSVVGASSDWDGMCRAWSYQAFVFVGERFVGTLSPVLMDSRTDGA